MMPASTKFPPPARSLPQVRVCHTVLVMVDPQLLEGLEVAVAASPDNVPLRLHLGSLLLAAGRPADALEQCAAVLLRVPDHRDALDLAVRATMAAEPPRWANDRTDRGRLGASAESRGPAGTAG